MRTTRAMLSLFYTLAFGYSALSSFTKNVHVFSSRAKLPASMFLFFFARRRFCLCVSSAFSIVARYSSIFVRIFTVAFVYEQFSSVRMSFHVFYIGSIVPSTGNRILLCVCVTENPTYINRFSMRQKNQIIRTPLGLTTIS